MAQSLYGKPAGHAAQYALFSLAWGIGYWIIGTPVAERSAVWRRARLCRELHRPN